MDEQNKYTEQNPQYGQPMQNQYAQQTPQYGQPMQNQYAQQNQQYDRPVQNQYAQQNQQYGQPMQNQYVQQIPQYSQPEQMWQQPYQQQNSQASQWSQPVPQYGQPQNGQPGQQPYDNPMGYMGYENRQDTRADVKKGSTHIPNILNIVGIIMALVSVFLPYAHIGSDVRTISGVFGITVLSFIIVPIVILADVICAFIDKAVCYIVDLIISIAVGGALILEFVLALIDLKKMDPWEEIGLSFGSWFSVAAALLLLASVPVWWIISRKKKNADASEQN